MSESKQTSLIDIVQEFCLSSKLETDFESFAVEFKDIFMSALDLKPGDEHPMQYFDAYQDFLKRFERKIEVFIEKVKSGFRKLYNYNRNLF